MELKPCPCPWIADVHVDAALDETTAEQARSNVLCVRLQQADAESVEQE